MLKTRDRLLKIARSVLKKAYCPYSKFHVGAALITQDGKIFTGCNVENVSYGLTICAERVAIFNAISAGHNKFKAIAISSSNDKPVYPCGACRQVMSEFVKDDKFVIFVDKDSKNYKMNDLLPHSFTEDLMSD